MKTLLQINAVANSGSTGKIAEDIGKLAIRSGWRSIIAYGRYANPSASELIKIGDKWGVDTKEHGLETRLLDNHGLASRIATKKFVKQIEEIKPDVIQLHNIHGYYINYKILFECLSRLDVPIVWTLHDCWTFTGHCANFDFIGCDKWKSGCYACVAKKTYPTSLLMDRSRRNYEDKKRAFCSVKDMTLVPVSDWLAGLVKESFLGRYPVEVIHNGVDLQAFRPMETKRVKEKYGLEGKKVLIGVASVWSGRKGLADFVALSKVLPEEYVILLVGLNKEQIESLPKNIIGIEKTESREELAEMYSAADAFFNPTYEDNFPTTNIEALACGTPMVTYRTGGSVEAVGEGTGFIVEQGDIEQSLRVFEQIKQGNRETYRKLCRERAEQYYDKDKVFEEYIAMYEKKVRG
jgi:putative colanic acid biosynthesis glycosyltransferase